MSDETLKQAAREHLKGLHSTLWGRAFDISTEKGLDVAVDWLLEQMRKVLLKEAMRQHQQRVRDTAWASERGQVFNYRSEVPDLGGADVLRTDVA